MADSHSSRVAGPTRRSTRWTSFVAARLEVTRCEALKKKVTRCTEGAWSTIATHCLFTSRTKTVTVGRPSRSIGQPGSGLSRSASAKRMQRSGRTLSFIRGCRRMASKYRRGRIAGRDCVERLWRRLALEGPPPNPRGAADSLLAVGPELAADTPPVRRAFHVPVWGT